MLFTFLNHQWSGFWRSRSKGGSIAIQIVMGILILYILACALIAGLALKSLIVKFFPGQDAGKVFNGFILYYFAIEFLMRLQLQELPTLSIVPYLHLNIAKRKLVNFLNIRALFSAFNILPVFLFFPFCATHIISVDGPSTGMVFMLSILSLSIFNNYFALYVKRLSTASTFFVFASLFLLLTFATLEYFKIFSISEASNWLFSQVVLKPALGFLFPVLAIGMFQINALYLRKNLYIESLTTGEKKKSATDYPLLNRFGEAGTLAALEIKLILRNKRSKATVSKGLIFILYGFLFYKKQLLDKDQFGMMVFAAVFMTGNMILLYGQFMFGWQSAEFDGLLAGRTSVKSFIKSKFLLFSLSSTILTLIVSLYGLISWKILLIQFAAYFYSIGIASVLVLYFATRNYKYIDLSKGSSFNWQGVGASSMLMSLPIFLLPFVIYIPAAYFFNSYTGIIGVGIFGLAGLFTRSFWVDFLVSEFNKRRYKIAEGFRERS